MKKKLFYIGLGLAIFVLLVCAGLTLPRHHRGGDLPVDASGNVIMKK